MNIIKKYFLEKELQDIRYKKARFQALIQYKAELDRNESIFDKLIMAKLKVYSEYELLSEQLPLIESRINEIKEQLIK